jgi:type-F conjugative transfer system pilin assembly protein TrbC
MVQIGLIWFGEKRIVVRFSMEKLRDYTKRLSLLVLITGFSGIALATNGNSERGLGNKEWIRELQEYSKPHVFQEMQRLYKSNFNEEEYEEVFNPRPNLQIFVSRSMSLPLLKSYAREAEKYNAVLTFRGLPKGQMQFQKLVELVQEINGEDGKCAMNIDDESFEIYGINTVPAIVLSENLVASNLLEKKAPLYDKVVGSVSLNYALELFAKEGVLSEEATLIKESGNDS